MPDYIDVPIVTDPDTLAQIAYDHIQSQIPGWLPFAGELATVIIESVALIASFDAFLASAPPTSIFRYLGAKLFGIPPLDATPAAVASTWTMTDTAGYTINAGTLVDIPATGDESVAFAVLADVTVPPGSTVTADGAVSLIALFAGAAGSGLGGNTVEVSPSNQLDFVASVELTGETTGGVDAETDTTYKNRLRTELQLLTPRPILPADFAALALSIAGVARAVTLDGYSPAVNELEQVAVNATGGTFTLTFSGQTTGAIQWNASAADVQTALVALSNLGPGDVLCTGGPLPTSPVTVEFKGAQAGTNVTQMTANSASLTGGTHTATITTTRGGAAATTNNERTVTVALVDTAGQPVTTQTKTDVQALLEGAREVNFVVNVIDPTYTALDVVYTATAQPGQDPAAVETSVAQAVVAYLNPATWGAVAGDQFSWVDRPAVRYLELARVIGDAFGVDHLNTLTFCVHGGTPATTDVSLNGPAGLPTIDPADIDGTVT